MAIKTTVSMTQKQFDALVLVYLRWQENTPHPIMPQQGVDIVSEEEYGTHYYGVWVGAPYKENPGHMFLGIEADGYTHS